MELWNVELTECKHHWNNLEEIWGVISISEKTSGVLWRRKSNCAVCIRRPFEYYNMWKYVKDKCKYLCSFHKIRNSLDSSNINDMCFCFTLADNETKEIGGKNRQKKAKLR